MLIFFIIVISKKNELLLPPVEGEDVFNALLPTPDARTQYKAPIIDASGIKA